MRTASLAVTRPSYRLPVSGSSALPFPSTSGVHAPESSTPSSSGAPVPAFSALLSLSGHLPILSVRVPGRSAPSLSSCLAVPGLSASLSPSASGVRVPGLSAPSAFSVRVHELSLPGSSRLFPI